MTGRERITYPAPVPQMRASVETFLRQFAGMSVLYHPNPGNGGDGLIATGTFSAFQSCGVNYTPIYLQHDVSNAIVFLGGGGNFIPLYKDIRNAILSFRDKAARIVLLPHTIRGNEDLLSEMDEKFTIFCRDVKSYAHVIECNARSEVYLAHDMAFHINAEDLLRDQYLCAIGTPVLEQKLNEHGIERPSLGSRNNWTFNRLDWESRVSKPTSDLDISDAFALGVWPGNAQKAAWCMLTLLSEVETVVTDRLHVAIACALVGTRCELSDNSYGKNSSVYRHSLRAIYPEVKLRSAD